MSNISRRSRAQVTTEPDATTDPMQDAPEATAPQDTDQADATMPTPEPEPDAATATEDAPATEDSGEQDAPAPETVNPVPAPDAPAPETVDAPADDAPVRTEVTVPDMLRIAASADADQATREASLATAVIAMLRNLLNQVAALPDDEPVYADTLLFKLSGANGRGVAAARATLTVARALFGAGFYVGSTHDSVKRDSGQMRTYVIVPRLFAPAMALIMDTLHAANGPIFSIEKVVRAAALADIKVYGLRGQTEYTRVNKPSRDAMRDSGTRIAEIITSAFQADDSQLTEIRRILVAVAGELARNAVVKNVTPITDRFTPAPVAPVAVTPELAGISA